MARLAVFVATAFALVASAAASAAWEDSVSGAVIKDAHDVAVPEELPGEDSEAPKRMLQSRRRRLQKKSWNVKRLTAAHNGYRQRHCVRNLRWDRRLASKAQNWANKICNGNLRHSGNGPENLAMCASSRSGCMNSKQAMRWYTQEEGRYNYNKPGFSYGTGHFTQVVWREATRLGCGICRRKRNGMRYETQVCNYNKGNSGNYGRNVPRPC